MDIQVVKLSKKYHSRDTERIIFSHMTFDIKQGDYITLEGPSGIGKSTLLNIIGTLEEPSSGKVIIDGIEGRRLTSKQRALLRNESIGFVHQYFNLLDELTVIDNILLPIGIRDLFQIEGHVEEAKKLMNKLNITHLANTKTWKLSGGEKQRVAICRALIIKPKLILADEPTGSLDKENTQIILDTFKDLNTQGVSFLVVTHDSQVASCGNKRYKMALNGISEHPPLHP